jgi:5-methylcytosine-specific restriction endonuclease McrA
LAYGKLVKPENATAKRPINIWPDPKERIRLPWSLDYFRLQVVTALDDGGLCPYCHERLTPSNFSLDHKIPADRRFEFATKLEEYTAAIPSESGLLFTAEQVKDTMCVRTRPAAHVLLLCAFSWDNLALCCINCNKRKGVMTVEDWDGLMYRGLRSISDVGRKYVMKKLLLSEHSLRNYVMQQQKMIQTRVASPVVTP